MKESQIISSVDRRILDPEEIFISVSNFVQNSVALFIGRSPTMYVAFHVNCPHRYLSEVRPLDCFPWSHDRFICLYYYLLC